LAAAGWAARMRHFLNLSDMNQQDMQICEQCCKRAAFRYRGDWRELLGAAWEGYRRAKDGFDCSRNCSWSTYLRNVVTCAIIDYQRTLMPAGCRTRRSGRLVQRYVKTDSINDVRDDDCQPLSESLVAPMAPQQSDSLVDELIEQLRINHRDEAVLRLRLAGYSQTECAAFIHRSKTLIWMRLSAIGRKWKMSHDMH